MANRKQISGLILAGGAGSRVQGRDKGLIEWQGSPLISHVAGRLRPQVDQLLVSCNRNGEQYAPYADSLITDLRPGFEGPLAGIEAAVGRVEGKYLIIVACDTPRLPPDLAQRLLEPLTSGKAKISYANDGAREQYLFAAIHSSCLSTLGTFLESGQRAVRHWYQTLPAVSVDFSDQQECFANYNQAELFNP
jgi:molybdopterin-guanine dinucleotide biosynthesis protein A